MKNRLAAITVALTAVLTSNALAGQGAGRMLYTVPNSAFIENSSGDNEVTINDASGSIATLQALINNARVANPGYILVIHLLSGATYWVNNSNGGLVLGSQECLIGSGALIEATNSAVTNTLITISTDSTNVSIAGGTLNGNGANIYCIYAPSSSARINIDKVTAGNCGQDCIQLNGQGDGTFDNELTVTRCDISGSPNHAGISIWNATQTTCVDNNCHSNSVGIWLGNCGYCNIANNTCESNTTGIDFASGNNNYIANNTCNNNGTGILLDGSSTMVVSDAMGSNTVAGINSSGSGNIYVDNLFTGGNAANFINNGSGDDIVPYEGALNGSGQNYFYPPLINSQHTDTIVNGMGRYDLTNDQDTVINNVQSLYNAAVSANPGDVIVLHLNGNYTVGANPLNLGSYTCVLLGGEIQMNSSTTASCAIASTNQSYFSISGGVIDGGSTSPPSTGRNGIRITGDSMFQIDSVTLQNFGNNTERVGGSDVIQIDHGNTPRIITRCMINGGSARGIWLATSGPEDIVSDNTVVDVQMDGVDCDESTSGSLIKFNTLTNNARDGVFLEQSASDNCVLGNVCNFDQRNGVECYNNSATPRGSTSQNSVICSSILGGNGLGTGSTGTNVVTSSDNFFFDNTVMSSTISSQLYGTQNYFSQNYLGNSSLSSSSAAVFFNSPDVSGYLNVQDHNSGLYAVVTNAATTNGAPVILGQTNALGSDQWSLIPTDSGYYRVMDKNSGLAMVVLDASTNDGAPIIQWTYNASGNDEWMPVSAGNGLYSFVNRLSGLSLDVSNGSTNPGTQLDQQPSNGLANQKFSLIDAEQAVTAPVWDGGSTNDSDWSDPNNWDGVTLEPNDNLYFGGVNRLNNTNDTTAGTTCGNITFVPGAGSFNLNGNYITLSSNIINESVNVQTDNISMDIVENPVFNAGTAGLVLDGGVTNTSAAWRTVHLQGTNGILAAPLQSVGAGLQGNLELELDYISGASNSWSVVGNNASYLTNLTVAGGSLTLGTGTDSPFVAITNNTGIAFCIGTVTNTTVVFTLNSGTLNSYVNSSAEQPLEMGELGSTGIFNINGGTLNLTGKYIQIGDTGGHGIINQSGGTVNANASGDFILGNQTNATGVLNVNGGRFNIPANAYVGLRGSGTWNISGSGMVFVDTTLNMTRNNADSDNASGTVNLNGGTLVMTQEFMGNTATGQTGAFNFNSGVLEAAASSTSFLSPASSPSVFTTTVEVGGAIINDGGNNITVSSPLTHQSALGSTPDGGLTKEGAGTLTLSAVNTYTGNTTISAGTLALNGSGAIASSNIIVAGEATFNVSGLSATFTLGSSQTLSNSVVSAIINGTNNTASGKLSLVYDGVNPSFIMTNGGMTLSGGTVVNINNIGSALGAGTYTIITHVVNGNGGLVSGTAPAAVNVSGGGVVAGANASLQISGGALDLLVTIVPSIRPTLTGLSIVGRNVLINGTNGVNDGIYYLLSSTNLALPLSQWTPVATNVVSVFSGLRNFIFTGTNAQLSGDTRQFYILSNINH